MIYENWIGGKKLILLLLDGKNVLVTPNGENGIAHVHRTFSGYCYLKDDGEGGYVLDFERPFTSGYKDGSNYYDDSGALVRVEETGLLVG